MDSRWLRALGLTLSVAFILPPWCCFAFACPTPAKQTAAAQTDAVPKPHGCCACARHATQATKADAIKKPTEAPHRHCPCSERSILLASVPPIEQAGADFALCALVPALLELPIHSRIVDSGR